MSQGFKNRLWPNLNFFNHQLESEPTDRYNCVAWATHINDSSIDFSLDEDGEPLVYPDLSCLPYIEYFQQQGFVLCESPEFEERFEKIVLYERADKTFEHVARQLPNGNWTSKLGEWKDIEHTTLAALQSDNFYGVPAWFMKRPAIVGILGL